MNEGWKCPVCAKGNAPHADKCGHCMDFAAPYSLPNTHPHLPENWWRVFGLPRKLVEPPPAQTWFDSVSTQQRYNSIVAKDYGVHMNEGARDIGGGTAN